MKLALLDFMDSQKVISAVGEINPCPVCGSIPFVRKTSDRLARYVGYFYSISCDDCFLSVMDRNPETVAHMWN